MIRRRASRASQRSSTGLPRFHLPRFPSYWYWIYSGLGYSSRTCCGVIIGLSFL